MPYQTPDASAHTSLRKIAVSSQVTNSLNVLKFRAPLTYGGFYRPSYGVNIKPRETTEINPIFVTLDFTDPLEGIDNSYYVEYTIPSPTNSITITYSNLQDSNVEPEIDSETFDFGNDNTTLIINGVTFPPIYGDPFFATYAIWTNETVEINNGSTVKIVTNSLISGTIYVGYF